MSSPERDAVTTAATSSPPAPGQFTSWQAVADFLRARWGEPDASAELGAVAEMIVAAEPTPAGRIARALAYVRRDVRSADEPLRLDRTPLAPSEVLRTAAGGMVDRAALLWHLLRRVGLPARPVFVGAATSAGDSPPSLAAFDRVLVEVAGRCHSVDAPDVERDRLLADTPLGLTLASGIVDLEPIAPWQPAPAGSADEATPKPPPIALRPTTAPGKPVQAEFGLDFASMVTARAAEVEAALFAPFPPSPPKPAAPRERSATASPAPQILAPVATPPAPPPEPAVSDQVPDARVATPPEPAPEVVAPIPSEPPPPKPVANREPSTMASPSPQIFASGAPAPMIAPAPEPVIPAAVPDAPVATTPESAPEMVAPPSSPPSQPVSAEPFEKAGASMPPAAEVSTPPASQPVTEKATPREPARKPSLREELAERAKRHQQGSSESRANAPSRPPPTERRNPIPLPARANDEAPRGEYEFDPTFRARRRDLGGQFKISLMVIGFLAVIALWVFVFMAKRHPPQPPQDTQTSELRGN